MSEPVSRYISGGDFMTGIRAAPITTHRNIEARLLPRRIQRSTTLVWWGQGNDSRRASERQDRLEGRVRSGGAIAN